MGAELDEALQKSVWDGFPKQSGVCLVTFVNPFSYFEFCANNEIINNSDFIYADGALLVLLNNLFSQRKIERVSFDFSSIAQQVFDECEKRGLRLALVGATELELDAARTYLLRRFPAVNVCFLRNGYFHDDKEVEECYQEICKLRPDVVLCGMGVPKQEKFLIDLKKRLIHLMGRDIVLFTCGGFLSQTGMRGDYYYPLVKKLGLRWLQRFIMHSHVRRRVLLHYPRFVIKYIYYKVIK